MTRLRHVILLATSLGVSGIRGQQEPAPTKKAAPATDIFSGTVTVVTSELITVVRKVMGHDAVTRSFVIDAGTSVEGKLRVKARVTVRFKPSEEGGIAAVHIIVR